MSFLSAFAATGADIAPIVLIIFGFQYLVVRQPVPNLFRVLAGFALVWVGLALFIVGLQVALFPLGELMATQLTSEQFLPAAEGGERSWLDYGWVYGFAFAIGAATTIAEPSVIAVGLKAGEISGGAIQPFSLRIAIAVGVAVGISLGSLRIVVGFPLEALVVTAYLVVMVQTVTCPKFIIPLAFDAGGVTTSTITVPIVAALGLGLASAIPGRSPLLDGFGMIALASIFPIISVMGFAQFVAWRQQEGSQGEEN